jgi:hypothetical protein
VRSGEVVVVEPGAEGFGALGAVGVEAAAAPVVGQCLDEAFSFAVGARPVGPGEQVLDADLVTGEAVLVGAVGRPVVGG